MTYTVTESLPMVAIFTKLEDLVCAVLEIGFLLRNINTLSVGEKILTMRSKERSKCGRGWSIVLVSM